MSTNCFRPTVLRREVYESPGRDQDTQLAWQEVPSRSQLLLAHHCGARYGQLHTSSQHASPSLFRDFTQLTGKSTRHLIAWSHFCTLYVRFQIIQVKFDKFALEVDSYCRFDYVAFFNGGEKDDSRLIGKYCGDETPEWVTLVVYNLGLWRIF